jgi:hypothetical protein
LKLSAPRKLPQPWQAYLNLFQDTKLKASIEDAWKHHTLELPKGGKSAKTRFEIRNRVAQKLYQKETDDVKQKVEEHRLNMRSIGDVTSRNQTFQR